MKYRFLILFALLSSLFSKPLVEENSIHPLVDNNDWKMIEVFDDGVRLYEKQLGQKSLKAYRIETETEINKEKLVNLFESVQNYREILPSAKNITFDIIDNQKTVITAYQHIEIPLINNRHYFYKLYRSNEDQDYSYWQLIQVDDQLHEQILNKNNLRANPIKLTKGAGVYRVVTETGKNIVQYSLFLDSEGRIPEFIANGANKRGLINMFRDILNYSEKVGS